MASQDKPAEGQGQTPTSAEDEAKRQFIDGLIARGEAAKAVDGKLPPGATHEIVGEDEHGRPIVVRRRFSIG
jgi:hypothetical protein